MYAVFATGGKQYRVEPGEIIRIEKIEGKVGETVSFDDVLMFSDEDEVRLGTPKVDGVAVTGHILEQGKSKKTIVFKYKRRKRYRKKQGHRQPHTAIRIEGIGNPS